MALQKLHWQSLLAAGVASGLLLVASGVTMYLAGVYFASWSGPLSLALLAVGIAGGTRWYLTRAHQGRSTYLTRFVVGLCIALCTALLYAAYNVVSVSYLYQGFFDDMAAAEFARQTPVGGAALESLESLRARLSLGMVVANNVRAFCLVGAATSAILALVTREPSRGKAH